MRLPENLNKYIEKIREKSIHVRNISHKCKFNNVPINVLFYYINPDSFVIFEYECYECPICHKIKRVKFDCPNLQICTSEHKYVYDKIKLNRCLRNVKYTCQCTSKFII